MFPPLCAISGNAGFAVSLTARYLSHIWSASVRGELFVMRGLDVGVSLVVFSLIWVSFGLVMRVR